MSKKYLFLFFTLLLLVPLALSGCGGGGGSKAQVEMKSDMFHKELPPVPERPKVDVYWDTSLSMAGYTTIPAKNSFRELPDEIMDMSSAIGQVEFFRFGASIIPMLGNEYHKLISENAYTEMENSLKTVIEAAKPEHLTVVVTDLFETDSAWSAVTKKLQEKYFRNLYAVGVAALRSPFNGTVYDVGLDHAKFEYNSGTEPKRFRPVYMMVMGPDKLVSDFLKRCDKKKIGAGSLQLLMLSSQLTEEPTNAKNMPEVEIKNLIEQEKLPLPEGSNAVEYKLHDWDKPVIMTRTFQYAPNAYVCQLDMKQLKPVLEVKYFDGEAGDWSENKVSEKSFECTVAPSEEKPDAYDIKLTFQPQEVLKKDKVNAVMLSIVPQYDGLMLPEWIQQWNMSGAAASDPSQFDGSKTVNLKRTITSLKDSVIAVKPPSLVNLEMYIDLR